MVRSYINYEHNKWVYPHLEKGWWKARIGKHFIWYKDSGWETKFSLTKKEFYFLIQNRQLLHQAMSTSFREMGCFWYRLRTKDEGRWNTKGLKSRYEIEFAPSTALGCAMRVISYCSGRLSRTDKSRRIYGKLVKMDNIFKRFSNMAWFIGMSEETHRSWDNGLHPHSRQYGIVEIK